MSDGPAPHTMKANKQQGLKMSGNTPRVKLAYFRCLQSNQESRKEIDRPHSLAWQALQERNSERCRALALWSVLLVFRPSATVSRNGLMESRVDGYGARPLRWLSVLVDDAGSRRTKLSFNFIVEIPTVSLSEFLFFVQNIEFLWSVWSFSRTSMIHCTLCFFDVAFWTVLFLFIWRNKKEISVECRRDLVLPGMARTFTLDWWLSFLSTQFWFFRHNSGRWPLVVCQLGLLEIGFMNSFDSFIGNEARIPCEVA